MLIVCALITDCGSRALRLLSVTAWVCAEVGELKTSTSARRTGPPDDSGAPAAGARGEAGEAVSASPKAGMHRSARTTKVEAKPLKDECGEVWLRWVTGRR